MVPLSIPRYIPYAPGLTPNPNCKHLSAQV